MTKTFRRSKETRWWETENVKRLQKHVSCDKTPPAGLRNEPWALSRDVRFSKRPPGHQDVRYFLRDPEAPCLLASGLPALRLGADPVPLAAAASAGDFLVVQESEVLASSDEKQRAVEFGPIFPLPALPRVLAAQPDPVVRKTFVAQHEVQLVLGLDHGQAGAARVAVIPTRRPVPFHFGEVETFPLEPDPQRGAGIRMLREPDDNGEEKQRPSYNVGDKGDEQVLLPERSSSLLTLSSKKILQHRVVVRVIVLLQAQHHSRISGAPPQQPPRAKIAKGPPRAACGQECSTLGEAQRRLQRRKNGERQKRRESEKGNVWGGDATVKRSCREAPGAGRGREKTRNTA